MTRGSKVPLATLFVVCFTVASWATPIPERIDGNTKVEGKLQIGSQATVEYRLADGKNVAVHVVVAPASGLEAR